LETRVTYGGAYATFRCVGAVLLVTYAGLVTPTTLHRARLDTRHHAQAMRCRAVVVDASRAVIGVTREGLQPEGTPVLSQRPVAIVVPELALEMFQQHAWDMAGRGYLRGVFTDLKTALEWAKQKAPLGPVPCAKADR
jgi:hypothetical protein